jgi:hypothetical protein
LLLVLGLALISCDGPNRGTRTQPSAASGFQVIVTATPNTVSRNGGATTITVKVFDIQGRLVDGAFVTVTVSNASSVTQQLNNNCQGTGFTTRGIFTTFCTFSDDNPTTSQPLTAIVTATVEDAVATTLITVF